MTERTALGAAILKHWRAHRPLMVRELVKQKQLDKAVLEAQELTGDLLYELVAVKKMDYQAAWETAIREWAFLPEEGPPAPKKRKAPSRSRKQRTKSRSGKSPKKRSRSRKRRSRGTSG